LGDRVFYWAVFCSYVQYLQYYWKYCTYSEVV